MVDVIFDFRLGLIIDMGFWRWKTDRLFCLRDIEVDRFRVVYWVARLVFVFIVDSVMVFVVLFWFFRVFLIVKRKK